jgi:hypothetical protein
MPLVYDYRKNRVVKKRFRKHLKGEHGKQLILKIVEG